MASELLLQRSGNGLFGAEPSTSEAISAMRQGEIVTATVRRARNPQFHKLFMALMQVVFDAQTRYPTFDQLLDVIKIGTGHFDSFEFRGKPIFKPRSISFGRMDETSFRQFFDRAIELIVTEILPGVDSADLEAQVMNIIDGQQPTTEDV